MLEKRVMLIGETGVGKSALIRSLADQNFVSKRAMAVEFCGQFINTPGEFLENSRFHVALITTAVDCDVVLMLQDATRSTSLLPPLFAIAFNRPVVGVVMKAEANLSNVERAERFLQSAGAKKCIRVDLEKKEDGLIALKRLLALSPKGK